MMIDMAARAARVGMRYPFRVWHFGDSVFMDALVELSVSRPGGGFGEFAYGMTKAWTARGSFGVADHVAPGAAIVDLWRQTGDDALLSAAIKLAEVWEMFPRCATAEAYLHTFEWHQNVAIDCAHFDGPFFAKLAGATGDERFAARAVYELTWRLRLLQDEASGLCHHSFNSGQGWRGPLWGRGQGWALLGLVDTLSALPASVDGRAELSQRLDALVAGLVRTQGPDGHWHTVVDDESSYLETSVAAFVVAALARAGDLVTVSEVDACVDRAWVAVRDSVDADGVLVGVSAETPTTLPASEYLKVPTGGLYPWGQGPLILAAVRSATSIPMINGV